MRVAEAPALTPTLDTSEVARLFCVKPSTVLTWVKLGRMPLPIVIGRTKRWPRRSVIERLLAGGGGLPSS